MKIKQYQVDAFASRVFEGSPAAVCPLEHWLDDGLLQCIAEENNLSETAFFVRGARGFELRWFTPTQEVDLCGHATLAAAHVLFERLGHAEPVVCFHTRSGELVVRQRGGALEMDFPGCSPVPCVAPGILLEGLGVRPVEVLAAADYLVVLDTEAAVRGIVPNHGLLGALGLRGVIVTAPGADGTDFVSRFFAPKLGVPEDAVTGSAHCALAPYWAGKLGKHRLLARQVSRRGGRVACEVSGSRVLLSGQAVTFMEAELSLPV